MRIFLSLVTILSSLNVVASNDLMIYKIDPFYNFSIKYPKNSMKNLNGVINPVRLDSSNYEGAEIIDNGKAISSNPFRGEVVYKSIVIENTGPEVSLNIDFEYDEKSLVFSRKNVELNLVSTWFQSGKYTTRSKNNKFLVQELLLKNDVDFEVADDWTLVGDKWYYIPPKVSKSIELSTVVPTRDTRRILIKISVPENVKPGTYMSNILITDNESGEVRKTIPVHLVVANKTLNYQLKDKYDIFIYTYLSLDPEIGKKNTYINGQNNVGDYAYQKTIFNRHIKNIVSHGFNGVIILDWREPYISDAFSILKGNKILNVAIYSQSPSKNKENIVSEKTVNVFNRYGFSPIFYGYDEPGGNEKLKEQLLLNAKINSLGGKSFNACFWDDRPDVLRGSRKDDSKFSYLAYSLGSHGQDKLLKSLPLDNAISNVKQLAYWHPHVENPTRNKFFMGYWLWSSGLDGVSPHGYYYLPHVSNFLKSHSDSKRSLPSPYNDFDMWDKSGGIFRHHVSVYPEQGGYINTLQWEALADGSTDLSLVLQLEMYVNAPTTPKELSVKGRKLLQEIKSGAKIKNSSAVSDKGTKVFASKMKRWKSEIKSILFN